jgi:hypothetical protein
MKLDELIGKYIKLRDRKALMEKGHKQSLVPINEMMEKIEAVLSTHLTKTGAQSSNTKAGTVYLKTQLSCTVEDRDAFLRFVMKNKKFSFIESKANKVAVREYLDAEQAPPPGVKVTQRVTVNVNRGKVV